MRKLSVKIVGTCFLFAFLSILGFTHPGLKSTNGMNLSIRNAEALATEVIPDLGPSCWSVSSTCIMFGCYDITHCGANCPVVRADKWTDKHTCGNN